MPCCNQCTDAPVGAPGPGWTANYTSDARGGPEPSSIGSKLHLWCKSFVESAGSVESPTAAALGQILSVGERHMAAFCVQRLESRRVLRCRRYSLSLGVISLAVAYHV